MKVAVTTPVDRARDAHQLLRDSGKVPSELLSAPIAQSWERCLRGGVGDAATDFEPGTRVQLAPVWCIQ